MLHEYVDTMLIEGLVLIGFFFLVGFETLLVAFDGLDGGFPEVETGVFLDVENDMFFEYPFDLECIFVALFNNSIQVVGQFCSVAQNQFPIVLPEALPINLQHAFRLGNDPTQNI